jgi:hypothetical protein
MTFKGRKREERKKKIQKDVRIKTKKKRKEIKKR